jgi:hypothetical protein
MSILLRREIWREQGNRGGTIILWLSFFLSAIIFLPGCDSGGSETAHLSGSNPDTPRTVSGSAPGLGSKSVPDGTVVELSRIADSGTIEEVYATTTTVEGKYAFDLGSLGLSFSGDLIIRIVHPSRSVQLRAFVIGERVDIGPSSETIVRLVLEKLASRGGTLSDFTLNELDDLAAAADLLAIVKGLKTGTDLEETITKTHQNFLADQGLVLFLQITSESGQTQEGPGDVGHFFPFEPGRVWRYSGKSTSPSGMVPYHFSAAVGGTKNVNNRDSRIFLSSESGQFQPDEEYRRKDSRGILFEGASYDIDPLSAALLPFREIRFPLKKGVPFVQFENHADLKDLDFDGVNESGTVKSVVMVEGFEDVNVEAGFFFNAAKIVTASKFDILFSGDRSISTSEITVTDWFVPGVGLVRSSGTFTSQEPSGPSTETFEEELIGFVLNGEGQGVGVPISPGSQRVTQGVRIDFSIQSFDSFLPTTWIVVPAGVVTIDSDGHATAVGPGRATLFAVQDGEISDPAIIEVDESKIIRLKISDLVYSSLTRKLYAFIASDASLLPGTITEIDPLTGTVGPSIEVEERPSSLAYSGKLALSKEGRYLYVGLNNGGSTEGGLRRLDLLQWTLGPERTLGQSDFCSTSPGLFVGEMEVLPDNPNAVAISLRDGGCSLGSDGVVIYDYDTGVARPNRLPRHTAPHRITFSDSPSLLYGFDGSLLYRMSVDAGGVQTTETIQGLANALGRGFKFDKGRFYGQYVTDPVTSTVVGAYSDFPFWTLVLPDSSVGRTFALGGTTPSCFSLTRCPLLVFDQENFNLIGSTMVGAALFSFAEPTKLVRWGEEGLAIVASDGQLILIRSSLVSGK